MEPLCSMLHSLKRLVVDKDANLAILCVICLEPFEESLPIVEDICQDVDIDIRFTNKLTIIPTPVLERVSDMTICLNVVETKLSPWKIGRADCFAALRLGSTTATPKRRRCH